MFQIRENLGVRVDVCCMFWCYFSDGLDLFRTMVLGSYEDRQKLLLSENGSLRSALRHLQSELIAILHSDGSRSNDVSYAPVSCCRLCVQPAIYYFYLFSYLVIYKLESTNRYTKFG